MTKTDKNTVGQFFSRVNIGKQEDIMITAFIRRLCVLKARMLTTSQVSKHHFVPTHCEFFPVMISHKHPSNPGWEIVISIREMRLEKLVNESKVTQ
jgi:hypothetical protein